MNRIDADNVNLGESFVMHIDSGNGPGSRGRGFEDKQKALSILETAKLEAKHMIEEARAKAEQEANIASETIREEARSQGYKSGYDTGYHDGLMALNEEFSSKIELFNTFIQSAFDVKKNIFKSAQNDIVMLVSSIAEKICCKKLEDDNEVLLNITAAAINLLKEKETVTIITNPLLREQVFSIINQLKENNSLVSCIKVVEDSSLSPDGTIVEGLEGRIDARINSQIDEIVKKLLSTVQITSDADVIEDFENNNIIEDSQKMITAEEPVIEVETGSYDDETI